MPNEEYTRLGSSDEGWCYQKCFKEALPFYSTSILSSMEETDVHDSSPASSSLHNKHSSSVFKIVYVNCRSIVPNLESLRANAASYKPDVIAVCETWLVDSITKKIPTASILRHPTLELLFVKFTLKHGPLSIGLYYRPPSSVHSLTEFEQFLESLNPNKLKSAVFLSDLNINLLSQSPLSQDILSTMLAFHLHQVVSEPTRVSSSTSPLIDHVYFSDTSLVNSCFTTPAIGNSDHLSITTILSRHTAPPLKIRRLGEG